MRWLLDEMLPHAAARILNERGHDAVCVADTQLRSARDEDVYGAAVAEGRVVVSEDEDDYARILSHALEAGTPAVPVVVVRKSRLRRGGQCPTAWLMLSTAGHWRIRRRTPDRIGYRRPQRRCPPVSICSMMRGVSARAAQIRR
ncbi:DUF5615 family PIN-like protein [Candidatus Poriferisodalis sp.]|uniref:DUF5615 family PIN-like protein n=1 Tax=Candidatus Poriferisodalis sp. TaxID=3101277 RepID=UPI003C70298B